MDRREALKRLGAGVGAVGMTKTGLAGGRPPGTRTPNILFLILDELRFPRHFPAGVSTRAAILSSMPGLSGTMSKNSFGTLVE